MTMLDLDPGKYGAFLWPAFAISAFVIGWMVVDSLSRAARWRKEAERLEALRSDAPQSETKDPSCS
jgi:heme exporter protein D